MVAYSFQKEFEAPILARTKKQTIRATGKRRHAHPGDFMQLYVGMRTQYCRKMLFDVDPVCTSVKTVSMIIRPTELPLIVIDSVKLAAHEAYDFIRADGFDCGASMTAFWLKHHGKPFDGTKLHFEGLVISWDFQNG